MSDPPTLRITPPGFLTAPALAAVMSALPEARVVGGAVRDTLAGRAVGEIDLATPRTPEQVVEALQATGIRAVPTGLDHGTVTAVANGHGCPSTRAGPSHARPAPRGEVTLTPTPRRSTLSTATAALATSGKSGAAMEFSKYSATFGKLEAAV